MVSVGEGAAIGEGVTRIERQENQARLITLAVEDLRSRDFRTFHMLPGLPQNSLTTDSDFRVYRRSNRQIVACVLPD
jgi:hypothetical protein